MRTKLWWAWCLGCALTGCGDVPVYPVPPSPVPPAPTPVPPTPPTPIPPQPDEVAKARWDAVLPGMTEAQVTEAVGPSKHRSVVGPGFLSMGYYVRVDGVTHYVEAVFDGTGHVSHKTTW